MGYFTEKHDGHVINDGNVSKKQYMIHAIENKSRYSLDDPRRATDDSLLTFLNLKRNTANCL